MLHQRKNPHLGWKACNGHAWLLSHVWFCDSMDYSLPDSVHGDSPGKNTGEGEVAQSCPTLCDPVDYSLPGSSIHGIFQARILEWVSISFSRRSSRPRDWTRVSHIVGWPFTVWAYGGDNEDNANLLQKVPCTHYYSQCPQPCSRPPLTHASARHSWTSWASLGQSFTPSNHPSLNLSFYLSVCILSSCVSFRSSIAYHFNKPVIREMLASWNEAFPPFQILKEFEKDRH